MEFADDRASFIVHVFATVFQDLFRRLPEPFMELFQIRKSTDTLFGSIRWHEKEEQRPKLRQIVLEWSTGKEKTSSGIECEHDLPPL